MNEKEKQEKYEEIKNKWFGEENSGTVTRGWEPPDDGDKK